MTKKTPSNNLLENLKQQIENAGRPKNLRIEDLVLPGGDLYKLAEQFSQEREERKLKSTQLRRVFHDIKRLEQDARRRESDFRHIRTQLALTLPELAYAYGQRVIPWEFYDLMRTLLSPPDKRFQDHDDLKQLVRVLTALLAYHRFHELRNERR